MASKGNALQTLSAPNLVMFVVIFSDCVFDYVSTYILVCTYVLLMLCVPKHVPVEITVSTASLDNKI